MRRIVARAKNLARTWLALGLAEPTPGSLLTSFRGLEKMVQGKQGVRPAAESGLQLDDGFGSCDVLVDGGNA